MAALITRIVLYVLSGSIGTLAAMYPGLDYNDAAGVLTVDINQISEMLGALVATALGGGTFAWSRLIKANGGLT